MGTRRWAKEREETRAALLISKLRKLGTERVWGGGKVCGLGLASVQVTWDLLDSLSLELGSQFWARGMFNHHLLSLFLKGEEQRKLPGSFRAQASTGDSGVGEKREKKGLK